MVRAAGPELETGSETGRGDLDLAGLAPPLLAIAFDHGARGGRVDHPTMSKGRDRGWEVS